jgi:hypothetical protein
MDLPVSPFFDKKACLPERPEQGEFFDQLISKNPSIPFLKRGVQLCFE